MIEKIETKRCILRKVSLDDAQAIFDTYAQDSDVTKYLSWLPHISMQDTVDFMYRCLDRWERGEAYTYVIMEKDMNQLIGSFDFRPIDTWASFGYVLAKSFRGKWYMTEVLSSMIQVWFSEFGFDRVVGYVDIDNTASAKVMEKSGMQYVGTEKWHLVLPFYGNEKRDAKMYEIYPS